MGVFAASLMGFSGSYWLQISKERREKFCNIESNRRLILFQLDYIIRFFTQRLDYEKGGPLIYLDNWPMCIEQANFTTEEAK